MNNASKWLNQMKNNLNKLTKNTNTKQIQNELNAKSKQWKKSLNSTSKQIQTSLHNHYQNIPQYKSQIQSQLQKTKQQSQHLNTEFQQKFHEFSQSNPTIKHYHSKYQTQKHNISKNIPKLNVKQSIDSTLKRSKNIATDVQSKAKQISDTSTKLTSTVSSKVSSASKSIANISPTKSATAITKPIYATLKATKRMITPNRWMEYLSKMKTWIMIYGFVGIASLMVINQLSYMGLLYLVRHRYDKDKQTSIFGVNMVWIYQWLNIPYDGERKHGRQQLMSDNKDKSECEDKYDILDEIQMQDWNITVDIKLAKMAYNALLYPRILSAVMLTFVIGTPMLRVAMWFRR